MRKFCVSFLLLLAAILYVRLDACNKRFLLYPFPRVGRRSDQAFLRSQRLVGLIKQPRIGRSDPLLVESDDASAVADPRLAYSSDATIDLRQGNGEKEDEFSAQRKNAPWTFFLVTPNFQGLEQHSGTSNFVPEFKQDIDQVNDD